MIILLSCHMLMHNYPVSVKLPVNRLSIRIGNFHNRLFKLRRHIGTNRKLDPAKTLVLSFGAISEQFMLIAGSIRPKTHLQNTLGQ